MYVAGYNRNVQIYSLVPIRLISNTAAAVLVKITYSILLYYVENICTIIPWLYLLS